MDNVIYRTKLFNNLGQLFHIQNMNSKEAQLNLTNFKNGIYLLSIAEKKWQNKAYLV
ncbi:MAG: hypothetical protein ACJAZ3_001656 [Sphingobacteriales bacterium]|jgi:hypothetical protein